MGAQSRVFSPISTKIFWDFFFKSNLHHKGVILAQLGIKGANEVEIEGYSKLSSKLVFGHWNPVKKAGENDVT